MKTPQDNNEEGASEKMQKRLSGLYSKQELPTYVSISEVEAMKARIGQLEQELMRNSELAMETVQATPKPPSQLALGTPSGTAPKDSSISIFRWINSFSYPQKFLIVSMLFIFSLVGFIPLIAETITRINDYGYTELYGTYYLRPTQNLLEDIQAHEYAMKAYRDREGTLSDIESAQNRIENDLQQLEVLQVEYGDTLKVTGELTAIGQLWEKLKTDAITLSPEQSQNRHAQLTSAVRQLIVLVGNSSFLILDPDLDTYYMMDAILLKQPELQDVLGKINIYAERIAQQETLSTEEHFRLISLVGQMETLVAGIGDNVSVGMENNASGEMRIIVEAPSKVCLHQPNNYPVH